MTLSEYRRELKKLGYRIHIERCSWGKHAQYTHIETGDKLTYNVFTKETLARWTPLFEFLKHHREALLELAALEDITALTK